MDKCARFLMVLAVLMPPATASAQRATTGTIAGRIVDSSGAVLPGVAISLQSERRSASSAPSATRQVSTASRICRPPPTT